MNSKAVNVSVVIVARHALGPNVVHHWGDVENEINAIISSFGKELESLGWRDEDIALACFVKAVGAIAKFDKIIDNDKLLSLKDGIERCAHYIENSFPSFSLKIRQNHRSAKKGG
jgi:adenine-specific DNA methylase